MSARDEKQVGVLIFHGNTMQDGKLCYTWSGVCPACGRPHVVEHFTPYIHAKSCVCGQQLVTQMIVPEPAEKANKAAAYYPALCELCSVRNVGENKIYTWRGRCICGKYHNPQADERCRGALLASPGKCTCGRPIILEPVSE